MGWNLPEQVRLQALSGCNRGAAVEADAIGEQQPKRTQSGSCRCEAGAAVELAIEEQQPKRTQSASS